MELFLLMVFFLFLTLFAILRVFSLFLFWEVVSLGVKIQPIDLVAMRLRNVPPEKILRPLIVLLHAIPDFPEKENPDLISIFEAHFLAGGNLDLVVDALIAAEKQNVELGLREAMAKELDISLIQR
ncbi:MAG: flotillin-like FloA family protein [Candidatus Rifleibacteriota bacterium]